MHTADAGGNSRTFALGKVLPDQRDGSLLWYRAITKFLEQKLDLEEHALKFKDNSWKVDSADPSQTCDATSLFAGNECDDPEQEDTSTQRHRQSGYNIPSHCRCIYSFSNMRWDTDVSGK